MSGTHPYISGAGNVVQAVNHLRNSFPAEVTAKTIKSLGIAPNNESYVINALRFVGVIDEEHKKTEKAASVFSLHQDDEFAEGFGEMVKDAYSQLFELHGDNAWSLDHDQLITFFRQTDQTGSTIGKRQAATFKALAGLSGHGELPTPKARTASKKVSKKATKKTPAKAKSKAKSEPRVSHEVVAGGTPNLGLTVRVEINLPADGEQATYDRIFKSIRENLLNG